MLNGRPYRLRYFRVKTFDKILFWETDLQSFDALIQISCKIRDRLIQGSRVRRVRPGDDVHQERRVHNIFGDWADLIEGGCKCDQAVPRDAAVGWLYPDTTAKCGRLTD